MNPNGTQGQENHGLEETTLLVTFVILNSLVIKKNMWRITHVLYVII